MIAAFTGLLAAVQAAVAVDPSMSAAGAVAVAVAGTAAVIGTAAAALRQAPVAGAPRMSSPAPSTSVLYGGSLYVTDLTGQIVIDRPNPSNRGFLLDPDAYVTVGFSDSPVPAPCTPSFPDEVDWELRFNHVHDTHLVAGSPAEAVQLRISWRVSVPRTIAWRVVVPTGA